VKSVGIKNILKRKGVASKMKPCIHFDGGVCYSDGWGEPFGEGCLLNHKDSCPHYNPTTLMTGKDKLIEYLQLEPNSRIGNLFGICPNSVGLNENQHRKCISSSDIVCSECWKLALDEEF